MGHDRFQRAIGPMIVATIAGLAIAGYAWRDRWLPARNASPSSASAGNHEDHHHESATTIALSEQARKNLGLELKEVVLTDWWQSVRIPATIVERPGHSHRKVPTPLTGVVKELFVHPNQLARPGEPLAEIELTGDTLATAQADLLEVERELELNQSEITRITPLVRSGAVPEKTKLQLEYERKRMEARRESKIQALQVLGLSAEQVSQMTASRKLLRHFDVRVPPFSSEEKMHVHDASLKPAGGLPTKAAPPVEWVYTVEQIDVFPGKRVLIGEELCSLAFHVTLFLEGQAFERESDLVARAMIERWPIKAVFETSANAPIERGDLTILFLDNVVDPASRAIRFFVPLANEVLHDSVGPQGERYRSWRFKPGQRATLHVPVEKLKNVIVLPADAVVREGAEAFVFRANGKALERQAVHVVSIGGGTAVLANDGSLYPGNVVAQNNAYQLNLALKQASGAAIDPHAGHQH